MSVEESLHLLMSYVKEEHDNRHVSGPMEDCQRCKAYLDLVADARRELDVITHQDKIIRNTLQSMASNLQDSNKKNSMVFGVASFLIMIASFVAAVLTSDPWFTVIDALCGLLWLAVFVLNAKLFFRIRRDEKFQKMLDKNFPEG